MSGFALPDGWTSERLDDDHVLIQTPSPERYMATVDFRARSWRTGLSTTGPVASAKKYRGRNWNVALVLDAVVSLEALLTPKRSCR